VVPAGRYTQITAGGNHTRALTADSQVLCWGFGQTVVPADTPGSPPATTTPSR